MGLRKKVKQWLLLEREMRLWDDMELSSTVRIAYPAVWKLWQSDVLINWVAFGPHGYYICDTSEKVYASCSSIILRTDKTGKQVPLRCASFGYGGSWVVVEHDGVVRSHGLTANVRRATLQQEIRHIQLCQTSDEFYYIEYMDGTSDWLLPEPWHREVRRVEGVVRNPTPFSSVNLRRLDAETEEYLKVCFRFATSWNKSDMPAPSVSPSSVSPSSVPLPHVPPPNVQLVYKVQYTQALDDLYRSYLKTVKNEQQLFHCTFRKCQIGDPTEESWRKIHTKVTQSGEDATICYDSGCSLCEILRTSFSVRFALDSGDFGSGIYSSSTSSKATQYSRNGVESGYSAMMVCNVAVGKPFFTGEWEKGRKKPPNGYNSVIGVRGHRLSDDEIIVYNDDAIRPAYLIIYDSK
ncbi:hypothetical protein FRB93_005246 [Tulasnella sp. JGI-2019a]|nr:hypothetical protein FRB93_005246 [Tulasnella sp. JGI-2019a]